MTNADSSSLVQNSDSDSNNKLLPTVIFKTSNNSVKHVHVLQCPECHFSTLISSTLQCHIKTNHPNIDAFTVFACSDCGAISTEKILLEDHMKLYHPKEDHPFEFLELRISINSKTDGMQLASSRPIPSTTNSDTAIQNVLPQSSSPPIITSSQKPSPLSLALVKAESASPVLEKSTVGIQGTKRRKSTKPEKYTPRGLHVNGDSEDPIVESGPKRIKLENSHGPNGASEEKVELTGTPLNKIQPSSSTTSTTMVCDVNGIIEALKNQHQQQQQQFANAAQPNPSVPKITATSIMMDSNVAKSLMNQLLASAQGKIELGAAAASSTNPTNLPADQALDMSMRPTLDLGQHSQTGLKTSELKISDLIPTDQFNLRGLLSAQSTVTTLGTPGIQQITIGLPTSNQPANQPASLLDSEVLKQLQSPSQIVSISQLQALLSFLSGNKPPVQTTKEASNLSDLLTSQMLLQANPTLVSSGAGGISLPLEGLSSSSLNLPNTGLTLTGNALKGFPFSNGELIPVASLLPAQTGGLGTFSLANSTLPSSLANFVTSLSGGNQSNQATSTSSGQPTISSTTQQLAFDGGVFVNQNNHAATTGAQTNLQLRPIQAVATNGGNTIATSTSNSQQVGLKESKSELSLNELNATDIDNSVVGTNEESAYKESGSSPSTSQVGSRRSKTGGRRSSGVGSRPHRQNFTANQNRILNDWYNEHHYKPYPSTEDTKHLANLAGLSYSQVKKWFANKRARTSSNGVPMSMPLGTSQDATPVSSTDTAVAAALSAARTATNILALTSATTTSVTTTSIPLQAISQAPMNSILVPSSLMMRPNGLTVLAPRPPATQTTTQATPVVTTSVATTEQPSQERITINQTSPASDESVQPTASANIKVEGDEGKTTSE